MAALEPTLISTILRDQSLKALIESGIVEADFQTIEGAEWFRFIYRHFRNRSTYGQVPSPAQFKRRFRGFDYCPSSDSLSSLCQELRDNQMVHEVEDLSERIQELLDDDDLDDVLANLSGFLRKWTTKRADGGDVDLAQAVGVLKDQYYSVKDGGGLLGIPYPWDVVNDETLGMQPGQLLVIYGRPKAMKTWVALYIAVFAYLFCNARVLFYSREMDRIQILRRAASIVVGLDYSDVKKATLPEAAEKDLWAAMELLSEGEDLGDGKRSRFVISNDRGANNSATVDLISQKARDYEVDLLVVDAVYKLKDGRTNKRDADWKTQAHVLQDLKDSAVDMHIPCIAVTQANRSASKNNVKQVDTSEVAFTDAAGMECDGMFRVIKGTDPDTGENELALVWAATRDEQLDAILIHGQPGYNFRLKREGITLDELQQRKAREDANNAAEEAAPKKPASAPRGRRSGRSAVALARQGAKRKK